MKRILALGLILLAPACGDDRPPAPTAEESAQLDETEALLNNVAETQEGPANHSAGPSNNTN